MAFLMGEHKVGQWADMGCIHVIDIDTSIDRSEGLGSENSPLPSSVPFVYDLSGMYSARCILRCWEDLRYRCQSDSCLHRSPSRPAKESVP